MSVPALSPAPVSSVPRTASPFAALPVPQGPPGRLHCERPCPVDGLSLTSWVWSFSGRADILKLVHHQIYQLSFRFWTLVKLSTAPLCQAPTRDPPAPFLCPAASLFLLATWGASGVSAARGQRRGPSRLLQAAPAVRPLWPCMARPSPSTWSSSLTSADHWLPDTHFWASWPWLAPDGTEPASSYRSALSCPFPAGGVCRPQHVLRGPQRPV